MKLTGLFSGSCRSGFPAHKIFFVMKMTAFLMIAFCLQVSAESYSQKITISENNVSLTKVLSEIEKQSGYVFWYESNLLEKNARVSVSLKNADIKEAMNACLANQPLTYSIKGKTIVLKHKALVVHQPGAIVNNALPPPITVTGKVIDENGAGISGATVMIKGSTKGTQTDAAGNFVFENVQDNAVLIFSSVGYESKEIAVGNRRTINITLVTAIAALDETVVVAYGTSKRKDLTGAIGSIGRKTIENTTVTNLDQLLQGRIPGVDVMISSGMPGAAVKVRIRGNSSLIGNNDPLYVVDGVPVITDKNYAFNQITGGDIRENLSGLLNINMNDVESIDVLKDASATAIYGSRAANGVVIITTRKGIPGQKPIINVGYDYGFQRMNNNYRPLNAREFREIMTEAATNGSPSLQGWWAEVYPHMGKILNSPEEYFGKEDINWLDLMTDSKASVNNFNISSRGGSKDITYYISYSNNGNNGVLKGSGLDRNAGKLQLDAYINPQLRVGTNVNISNSKTDVKNGGLTSLLSWRPDLPIYTASGAYFTYEGMDNPLAASTEINNAENTGINGSGYLEFEPVKGLFLRSSLAFSNEISKTRLYSPTTVIMGSRYGGVGQESISENLNRIFDNTVSYSKNWDQKHDLNALVGASFEHLTSKFFTAIGTGFPDDKVLNNLSSAANAYGVSGNTEKTGLISYFSQFNYIYDDRYLATVTTRMDGSSKFGRNNRYGFFPSGAVAWKMHNEKFMSDIMWLDQLKLRASYGLVGASSLGNYRWRTKYIASGYGGLPAIIPENMENPKLKWEKTKMFDAGVEFSLLDYRINGSFGYYSKYTSDLLQSATIPTSTGFINVTRNVSEVSNRGIEIDLNSYIIRNERFSWYLGITATKNTGRIEKLNEGKVVGSAYEDNRLIEGEPFGTLWGYVADGIFQSQKEVDEYNAKTQAATGGASKYYQEEFTAPGDIRFVDVNGDGKVDYKDQGVIGNSSPNLTGGITNRVNLWKNLAINIHTAYSIGGKKLWNAKRMAYAFYDQNQSQLMLDRWTPEHPTNTAPRISIGDRVGNSRVSSFWVHDYSYFKIQDIYITYRLPASLTEKIKFKNVIAHLGVSNIATFTNYPGMSPEGYDATFDGSFYNGSIDYSDYPMAKTWSMGLKFEL